MKTFKEFLNEATEYHTVDSFTGKPFKQKDLRGMTKASQMDHMIHEMLVEFNSSSSKGTPDYADRKDAIFAWRAESQGKKGWVYVLKQGVEYIVSEYWVGYGVGGARYVGFSSKNNAIQEAERRLKKLDLVAWTDYTDA